MKVLAALVVALSSSFALAMPAVSDYAAFDLTMHQSGTDAKGTLEMELTAYNATTQEFTQKQTVTVAGQAQTQSTAVKATDLASDVMITSVISNCAAYNGKTEVVATSAGSFNTCAITQTSSDGSSQTTWIAAVPFGIAKAVMNKAGGDYITFQLKNFRAGH